MSPSIYLFPSPCLSVTPSLSVSLSLFSASLSLRLSFSLLLPLFTPLCLSVQLIHLSVAQYVCRPVASSLNNAGSQLQVSLSVFPTLFVPLSPRLSDVSGTYHGLSRASIAAPLILMSNGSVAWQNGCGMANLRVPLLPYRTERTEAGVAGRMWTPVTSGLESGAGRVQCRATPRARH